MRVRESKQRDDVLKPLADVRCEREQCVCPEKHRVAVPARLCNRGHGSTLVALRNASSVSPTGHRGEDVLRWSSGACRAASRGTV